MAGTSQREIVVNHNHDNEMWTLESKTNNKPHNTNEINRERSSKSLDGYNTRDSILGNVLTWSDRPESDEQKRHKTEHKTIKKNTNHYSDLAAATKCCGKKKTNDGSTRKSVFQNLDQRAHNPCKFRYRRAIFYTSTDLLFSYLSPILTIFCWPILTLLNSQLASPDLAY